MAVIVLVATDVALAMGVGELRVGVREGVDDAPIVGVGVDAVFVGVGEGMEVGVEVGEGTEVGVGVGVGLSMGASRSCTKTPVVLLVSPGTRLLASDQKAT